MVLTTVRVTVLLHKDCERNEQHVSQGDGARRRDRQKETFAEKKKYDERTPKHLTIHHNDDSLFEKTEKCIRE